MAELDVQDFFIVNGYGFIRVVLSMFCLTIMLEFPEKGEKMNWKIVFSYTVGITITAYI